MQKKILLKLVVLGGISLVMLVALSSISGITRERKGRLDDVQRDIANSYAGSQRIIGPLLTVEFRESWKERRYNKETDTWYETECQATRTQTLYPDQLNYEGSLDVQERYRGIFKAQVFQSSGALSGTMNIPERDSFRTVEDAHVEMVSARLYLLISDPRGISKVPEFFWNETTLKPEAGGGDHPGIHVSLPMDETFFGQTSSFALDLHLHGTEQFGMVPLGEDNQMKIQSTWPHPSFVGDFLATSRTVTEGGFEAEWTINGLASTAQKSVDRKNIETIQSFGVRLIDPVNPYPLTDRALKYGFLFIFITFATFFLFELVKELRIHPIQYSFVGVAQSIFFLLLLSLSEHLPFGLSYFIASAATIGVISFYLCCVLKGMGRGLFFGGVLAVLYGVLYGLLQSEDHALVAGSTLLFGLIALVMVLTRNVDWYSLGKRAE